MPAAECSSAPTPIIARSGRRRRRRRRSEVPPTVSFPRTRESRGPRGVAHWPGRPHRMRRSSWTAGYSESPRGVLDSRVRGNDKGALPMTAPLLSAHSLSKRYGAIQACRDISFELHEGEALAIVGESGSGKTTLLHLIARLLTPDAGAVRYRLRDGALRDLAALAESERRALMRTDWGFVHQDSSRGLRMNVSAGGNIGERLMALGDRHYGRIRQSAAQWLERGEIPDAP